MRSSTGGRIGRNLYVLRSFFINRKKDSAPSDCPQYYFEDSTMYYYQKMIGWCCPLAFRPFLRYVVLICDTYMVCV